MKMRRELDLKMGRFEKQVHITYVAGCCDNHNAFIGASIVANNMDFCKFLPFFSVINDYLCLIFWRLNLIILSYSVQLF